MKAERQKCLCCHHQVAYFQVHSMRCTAADLLSLSFCFSLERSRCCFVLFNFSFSSQTSFGIYDGFSKTIMYLKCVQVMELLTLCCGARWISCCWSSSLLQLRSTSSVGPPLLTLSSAESSQLFLLLLLLNLLPLQSQASSWKSRRLGTPRILASLSVLRWYVGMLASCCSGVLLLVLLHDPELSPEP